MLLIVKDDILRQCNKRLFRILALGKGTAHHGNGIAIVFHDKQLKHGTRAPHERGRVFVELLAGGDLVFVYDCACFLHLFPFYLGGEC